MMQVVSIARAAIDVASAQRSRLLLHTGLSRVIERRPTQRESAQMLGLTTRHLRRLRPERRCGSGVEASRRTRQSAAVFGAAPGGAGQRAVPAKGPRTDARRRDGDGVTPIAVTP